LKASFIKGYFCFFLLISAPLYPQSYAVWYDNLEDGIQSAKAEGKRILLYFTGSDWCGWCKKLNSEVFLRQEFAEYSYYYLSLVRIDFPKWKHQSDAVKEYNKKLAQKFGVTGYPTIILLNKSGMILGRTGYREGGANTYIKHIKSFFN
jgi:protein disulfide-isomerase